MPRPAQTPLLAVAGFAATCFVAAQSLAATVPLASPPASAASTTVPTKTLSRARAQALGLRIWKNESNQSIDGLTAWNKGEEFASLGIGHFIWYPAGAPRAFSESFPGLLRYLVANGVGVPEWLAYDEVRCPWPSRDAFLKDFHSPRMEQLRELLRTTIPEQSSFIARRLDTSLAKLLDALPQAEHARIRRQFEALYASEAGLYALIDYVNFKGEGTNPKERYQGEGWGLLQVLQTMPEDEQASADAFASAAAKLLRRRVELSPPERAEARWLSGWMRRLDTYRR